MLLLLSTIVALAGSLARAQLNGQCAIANQTTGLCPLTYGGFHVLCPVSDPSQAVAACANVNMRLAMLTDANAAQALYTLQECAVANMTAGWVGGWNGAGADPCALLSVDGAAVVSLGFEGCASGLQLVPICQELPAATAIFTGFNYHFVTTGTSTSTVSVCTACNGKSQVTPAVLDKSGIVEKKRPHRDECDRRRPDTCRHQHTPNCPLGPCTPVCPFTVCGLHVVQAENLTFANAQEECARYGWNLADLTSAQHADVAFLQGFCSRQEAGRSFWIRSYNGVDGGECVRALGADGDGNVPVAFGIEADWCGGATPSKPWALCQDAGPAITGTGLYNGPVSFVTTVTVAKDTTVIIPSTTTTTTKTGFYTVPCNL